MTTGLYPQYSDCAIYKAKENEEKLIIQYYETGVTGNPKKRLIKVKNEYAAIRPYTLLEDSLLPDSLTLLTKDWKNSVPKVLIIENEMYELERMIDPYEWENYRQHHAAASLVWKALGSSLLQAQKLRTWKKNTYKPGRLLALAVSGYVGQGWVEPVGTF